MQPIPHHRTGRAPSIVGIRAKAAQHAKAAVEALAEVAQDAAAPADARVRAAEALLAYSTVPKVV
ncbi:hypothetical protein [Herminiimonas sp. CN]|uniref:hypothetical protein n=1 Tax=Herminiimonas sp. CN TaxID=1349818 RepID=UPI0012DF1E88|nr:hypothetical protein [Herminiimonas sp. CN]